VRDLPRSCFARDSLARPHAFPRHTGDEPEPADLSWALPRSISRPSSSSALLVPADRSGALPLTEDGRTSTDLESEGSRCAHDTWFCNFHFGQGFFVAPNTPLWWLCSLEVPNFLLTTKFFACLDLTESQQLFEMTTMVRGVMAGGQCSVLLLVLCHAVVCK
jgi:hypothetical protein